MATCGLPFRPKNVRVRSTNATSTSRRPTSAHLPVGATFEWRAMRVIRPRFGHSLNIYELTSAWQRITAGRPSMNNDNSNPAGPNDLINQATAIIMDRFGLESVRALELLRKMSQNTRTQICGVAEQVINHHVPVKAIRGLEETLRDSADTS